MLDSNTSLMGYPLPYTPLTPLPYTAQDSFPPLTKNVYPLYTHTLGSPWPNSPKASDWLRSKPRADWLNSSLVNSSWLDESLDGFDWLNSSPIDFHRLNDSLESPDWLNNMSLNSPKTQFLIGYLNQSETSTSKIRHTHR